MKTVPSENIDQQSSEKIIRRFDTPSIVFLVQLALVMAYGVAKFSGILNTPFIRDKQVLNLILNTNTGYWIWISPFLIYFGIKTFKSELIPRLLVLIISWPLLLLIAFSILSELKARELVVTLTCIGITVLLVLIGVALTPTDDSSGTNP